MNFWLYFFAVYFGIGFLLALILGRHSGNWNTTMVFVWPFVVYFGIRWNIIADRVNRLDNQLECGAYEGFCKLLKITQIEKTRNEISMCFIYTITFRNGKVKRYTIFDHEVKAAIMNRDNGVFYVMIEKILYNKVQQ